MTTYFVLTASNVNKNSEDILSGFFFDNGAEGVSEDLNFSQFDNEYSVETIESKFKKMNIYFSKPPSEDLLLKAHNSFPNVKFVLEQQENKDWMAEWKKGFSEFELTKGVRVVPSWDKPKTENLNIRIDPGMAFGTGTHATTQIAAGLLSEMDISSKSVIDVGTGTGILAIMADKFGANKVDATEIDDIARGVAAENVVLNKCKNTYVLDFQIEKCTSTYDIVIANIIDGVLIRIQEDLIRSVRQSGHLLLTGILGEREPHFKSHFNLDDFIEVKRVQKNEWVGFLFKRKK